MNLTILFGFLRFTCYLGLGLILIPFVLWFGIGSDSLFCLILIFFWKCTEIVCENK